MKKIKAKDLEELDRLAPEGEWVEVEFIRPVEVISVKTRGRGRTKVKVEA